MTEVFVFLIVGGIAILSAAMMLLSRNAVHSALYLVLNFVCVAFFFLTLNAPFIAIAQIAVYAGAIMVLFLFVIMLLGAERVAPSPGPFRWLPRAALVLALVFLLTTGLALASGEINLNAPPPAMPQVRVIHAADAPPVDVYLNNQLIFEDVTFRAVTAYDALPAGEYGVTIFPAGADPATESPAILGDLTLAPGDVASVVALGGDGVFQIARLFDQNGPLPDNQLRLTMLNGLPDAGPVDLVDPGVESDPNDSRVLIGTARFGETVESLTLNEAQNLTLDVLPADNLEADPLVVYRGLELDRNTNNLLIVAPETLSDGQVRDRAAQHHDAHRAAVRQPAADRAGVVHQVPAALPDGGRAAAGRHDRRDHLDPPRIAARVASAPPGGAPAAGRPAGQFIPAGRAGRSRFAAGA